MKRVLVTGAANIGKAGVATIVYKWGQEFDSKKIAYDYLMQSGLPAKKYQNAIEKKGGKMYTIENGSRSMLTVIKWIEKIIRENQYETIHINTDTAYVAAAYMHSALKAGIKNIYVHSHCTQVDDTNFLKRKIKTFFHYMFRPYVCYNTKMYLACSEYAGIWMFGKRNFEKEKSKIIYNGVEVEKYLFDREVRKQYRSSLNIEGKFVIGCIGRFSYQKNHDFLITVFDKLLKRRHDSVLMLVGDGELKQDLYNKVKKLGIEDKVLFLGLRNDVPQLLSAMDVLVMTSRFEGLPVTMVEAQMASLPCVVSGNITREAKFTDEVVFINGYNVKKWNDAICKFEKKNRVNNRKQLMTSNFNIQHAAMELQKILLEPTRQ